MRRDIFNFLRYAGSYRLSVGKSMPEYSRQMMLLGEPPPWIDPVTVEIDSAHSGDLIILRERHP